jgi:hypothetical protein
MVALHEPLQNRTTAHNTPLESKTAAKEGTNHEQNEMLLCECMTYLPVIPHVLYN